MPAARRSNFKACLKCKMLVEPEKDICPNCGGRDFTYEWEGAVIIIDPSKSEIAKLLEIEKPGRYAIRIR